MKLSQGFSLIEVLIAIFVFATGVLGVAGLQMKSLAMLTNSHSVNIAMYAANDMADRMRANPVAVFDGFYDNINGTESDPLCSGACTSAELAQFDAYAVMQSLNGELPEPTLSVENTGNNVFTISITWTERIGKDSNTKTHRVSFVPYKP
ncbi:MAG: type IV pilus modification protein PilV [Cellvibrionaceae bacterium]|nr:type IV pilus modification protein PilV [Cellvibrionaceae bacterium]